ncbi:MAG: SpoIID/LytB domain-containing protein [Pseudobdellovibrionaceae bacterium]|nr:MAG: SpoIID/LytB domain-containing protein [Pseudobdellovibrionaceae bacterium]
MFLSWPVFGQDQVRVRIKRNIDQVTLAGFDLAVSLKGQKTRLSHLPKRMALHLVPSENGLSVYSKDLPEPLLNLGFKVVVSGEMMHLNGQLVPENIEFSINASSRLRMDAIALLPLEKYLEGVIPSEMPASWPLEALKAQAVASRSYAMSMLEDRRGRPFHLESSVEDQVYNLSNHLNADQGTKNKILKAIEETRGEYLKDNEGHTLKAYYHADCGGQTELPKSVWNSSEPGGVMVKDSHSSFSPNGSWKWHMDRGQLRRELNGYLGLAKDLKIKDLTVAGHTGSGRVDQLKVSFANGENHQLSAQVFREVLGFNKVKSAYFKVQLSEAELFVEGRGHGHGVGLCQYGAKYLAKRGQSYRQILQHYYGEKKILTRLL